MEADDAGTFEIVRGQRPSCVLEVVILMWFNGARRTTSEVSRGDISVIPATPR